MLRTIAKSVDLYGPRIHAGGYARVTLSACDQFGVYVECEDSVTVRSKKITAADYNAGLRTSQLSVGSSRLACPEHLFAALSLCRINSVAISIDNSIEFPCNGVSGETFYESIQKAGVIEIDDQEMSCRSLPTRHELYEFERSYLVEPCNELEVAVELSWPNIDVCATTVKLISQSLDAEFLCELSRARTWIIGEKMDQYIADGLCLGVSDADCQILAFSDFLSESVRRECALHKMYDLFGDLYMLLDWPSLRIACANPNHRMNVRLMHWLNSALKLRVER